jgi:predicted RNA binding protein YcfA (HicA-like mRNA interferase family)
MKLPRNISGQELIKSLQKLGYTISRQKGSHVRLTTASNGVHHITIRDHNPIKIAVHFKQTKEEIAEKLFG